MFTGPHLFNCSVRGVPARNFAHTKIIVTLNYFSKFPPVMKIEWPILFCPLRHAPSDAKAGQGRANNRPEAEVDAYQSRILPFFMEV